MAKDIGMKKPHAKRLVREWKKLKSGVGSPYAGSPQSLASVSPQQALGMPPAYAAPHPSSPAAGEAQQALPDKYVAAQKQIRLGKAADAAHGLRRLLGVTDDQIGSYYQQHEAAIEQEFASKGDADDKDNLARILAGTFRDDAGETKSLEELLAHPSARMAKLGRHHILALRLYTTCSFSKINDPLRSDLVKRPHPFAATTFFISEGIKMLRAVEAQLPDAYTERIYWRGMKDLGITGEFMTQGGTDFACVSTTAHQAIAVHNFASSALPLVFKVVTKNCLSRGADISFLSVYPTEQEAL